MGEAKITSLSFYLSHTCTLSVLIPQYEWNLELISFGKWDTSVTNFNQFNESKTHAPGQLLTGDIYIYIYM